MADKTSKRITLGSGKLYVTDFNDTIPELDTLTVQENLLGYIKGGATLEYTPEFYDAVDDLGLVTKTIITSEEAILKSGIMTFNGHTLSKLCDTARVTEDNEKHLRTVLIGGVGNAQRKKYIIVFHHEDPRDGDIWVLIVGNNRSGFSLSFVKDEETVIDAEFKALSQDDEGTLIKYVEEDKSLTPTRKAQATKATKATAR